MGLTMSVQEFLDSLPSKGTKKVYKSGLKKFFEWYGKSAEEVLKERKDDLTQIPNEDLVTYRNRASNYVKIIERFHTHLIDEGYRINTAKSLTNGIRQLFRFYQMDIKVRSGSSLNRVVITQRNFPLNIEHVRRMYAVANFRERVILSMATDLGLRISDFLEIKKDDLPDLSLEAPISFDVMTGKENVLAKGFLSQETVDLLKKYIETLPEDNPYLFPSSQKAPKPISKTQVGNLLRDLAQKAGIKVNNGKRLTFHCFRKMFLSGSIDSGVGLTVGKILCGKTVENSDSTYLTTVKLRQHFIQLKKFLTINEQPKIEAEKIESLKGVVNKLQEELTQQKIITDTISEENLKIKKELHTLSDIIDPIQPMLEFVNSFESPSVMLEFLTAIKERSAVARQRAESMPLLPRKAKALLQEAIFDIIQKESERVKQLLARKTGITDEDILEAAIQAAKESIEEEYGVSVGDN